MNILILLLSTYASAFASASAFAPADGHFFLTNENLLPERGGARGNTFLGEPAKRTEPTDCRAHIREVMCLADPPKKGVPRVCLEGGEAYATVFEELHDQFPAALQKVFCSLDVIYIEKSFYGTAYAGLNPKTGVTSMGIRKSVLDERLDLQTWSSWKEQLSFGGVKDSYEIRPMLPETSVSRVSGVNDFLYFVLAHEFGHILDFANDVNSTTCDDEDEFVFEEPGHKRQKKECVMKPGTWGDISWLTDERPRPENEFRGRRGFCFYDCKRTLRPERAAFLYRDLEASEFISAYATTQAWDDFADSLAYYLVDKNLGQSYTIDTKRGFRYDAMAKLKSPVFAKKLKYIEEFLARKDLRYP